MARSTPGTGIPVPVSSDPRTITADLWASFSKVGTLITQTSGESAGALTAAQAAQTAAAQALARALAIEEPIHVGPNPPTDGEALWVDTDEDAHPTPVSSDDITDASDVGRAVLTAPLSANARNALAIYTGTRALLDAGTDTAERTWDAKELSEYVTETAENAGGASSWADLTDKPTSFPSTIPDVYGLADALAAAGEGDPAGPDPFEGAALTLQDTGHAMIPTSIGVDGWLYGYSTSRTRPVRSGDSLDTAPVEGPNIHDSVPVENRGRGIAHLERTSTGFVVIYEASSTAATVWHSPTWEGPYTKTLDIGPWHFTSRAKSRLVAGNTWMLLGEYTNSAIPSTTRRRWLSTNGGESWKLVRSDAPITTEVNNHCHTGLIRADGRIYVSDGDGTNNWFGYSDDQGTSWVPVPTDPRVQIDSFPYSQPTVLIDFGDRIALSPDRGPYQPGMWTLDPNSQAQSIVWELAEGGPYSDASKQYARSVFAQAGPTGQAAYVMFPPAGSGNTDVFIAATPDGGRRWGVVATIPNGDQTLNTGVYGPDRHGNLFMRGAGIPTYGGNVIRAKQLDWNV